jgi:uncharacterized protein (DUF488 family)
VEIFTIGFTKTTARDFFERLRRNRIERLLDVRLNNRSQLAGFAKRDDLVYFLTEIVGATYEHELLLAPTQELLDAYKKAGEMTWPDYEDSFLRLISDRGIEDALRREDFKRRTVLLCSEDKPTNCHRRLVAEYLAQNWQDIEVTHL